MEVELVRKSDRLDGLGRGFRSELLNRLVNDMINYIIDAAKVFVVAARVGGGGEGLGHHHLGLHHLLLRVHIVHRQEGEGAQVPRPRLLLPTRPELLICPLVSPEISNLRRRRRRLVGRKRRRKVVRRVERPQIGQRPDIHPHSES